MSYIIIPFAKHYELLQKICIFFLLGTLAFTAKGQNIPITGIITDQNGEAIAGASIIETGTTNGTISDENGNFSINIPNNTSLEISCIGFITQKIAPVSGSVMKITLKEDSELLDDVIVIGYGTIKKTDLTGAMSSVNGNTLANNRNLRTSQSLQGTMPGIWVTRSGSDPSSTASIRVRGITTINNSEPLVIVDGIPGTLDWVNPNDIESISVMKDAASASIYGSRAASGVIIVTTKRAKMNNINIEYSYDFSINKPTEIAQYAGAETYMNVVNERDWNDKNNEGSQYTTYNKELIENYSNLHKENPDAYPDTDWMDAMMKDYSTQQTHRINIISGTNKSKAKITASLDKSGSLIMHKNYNRAMIRTNFDISLYQWLNASVDINGIYSTTERPSRYTMTSTSRLSGPIYAAKWSDGRIASGKSGTNVYALMAEGGTTKQKNLAVGSKISLNVIPFNGLTITGVFAPQFYMYKQKAFSKEIPYTEYDDPNTVVGDILFANKTTLIETRPDNLSTTTQLYANYNNSFHNHNINLMFGYENFSNKNEQISAERDNYLLRSYPYLDVGNANYQYANGSASQNNYRSYYGRLMYNYNNKYFFQANGRYDGSSRFAKKYRWGFFPSFSAGWLITEEQFMKNWAVGLSSLKIRASWGQLGNERIGNYPYQSTINFTNDVLLYRGNSVESAQAAGIYKYAVHDISWETTESWDFGIDADFLENRLHVSGDYYRKETKDMLLSLKIPDYIGLSDPDQNTGKMHTRGWEISLGWHDSIGNLNYSATFNISDSQSIMGDLGGTEFLGNQIKRKGSQFNEWYGYKSNGIYQTQEEVDNSAKLSSNIKPGDIRYVDISGPDGIPDGKISPEYDRVYLGGSLPRYTFGGSLDLDWKNFDFSLAFQGVGKQNALLTSNIVQPLVQQFEDVPKIIVNKYWSKLNSDEQNRKVKYPRISEIGNANNYAMSDFWLFNGGYFRIKNISLGYTFNKNFAKYIKTKNVHVYLSISDPFCFSNYPNGYDPEAIDKYWVTTSYILGISMEF